MAQSALPSVDVLLGPAPAAGQAASVESLLGPAPTSETMPDWLFEQGDRANILKAFGQGAEQGWGSEPLGLSPDTEDFLKKAGIFNDYQSGHTSFVRTFNEAMIRPAAAGLDAAMRAGTALFRGAQAGIGALGEFVAHPPPHTLPGPLEIAPDAVQEAAAVPEAFPRGLAEIGTPTPPEPVPVAPPGAVRAAAQALSPTLGPPTTEDISRARALGVIGEGEGGYQGTVPIRPEDETARTQAVRDIVAQSKEEPPPAGFGAPGAPPPDIHSIARQIAPDTFREYDGLSIQNDMLRRQLDDMRDGSEAVDLGNRIDALRGQRLLAAPAERPALADQITAMEADRARLVDAIDSGRDTEGMAAVRQRIQQNDYRMRDLAPQVSEAYRQAQAGALVPEVAPPIPEEVGEAPVEPTAAPEPAVTPEAQAPRLAVPSITDDVAGKLIAAGRPTEEATAASQLVEAYYTARAARFDGAKGTPEELYAAEAPGIEAAAGPGRAGAAGKTVLRDGQATISLFGRADASTFIHEIGHSWLEELMRDGIDPAAPNDLRGDLVAVRNWLGAEPGIAELTGRQHEKFARGFERYMMEGRAPSAGLANVFAKFKNWLTQIYQTVARLRTPITDDIRGVFDRMLATPAGGTVIAPEREVANFADEHERLAEETPPQIAHAVADRVRAEADRHALERAPDVYDELSGAGSGTEADRGPAAGRGPDRDGPAPGPRSQEARTPEPVGAVGAGGGEAAPESAGLAPAAAIGEPDEPFVGSRESRLVDRAGNIRLDLLTAPEEVKQAIRDAASENDDFLPQRRGVIPDAEVLRLGDALGPVIAPRLLSRRLGQAFNAEQVIAARKLLVQSATTVRDLMMKAADGSDADVLAYAEAKERHRMIQGQVAGVTAEAGRALRAFAQVVGEAGERAEAAQMEEFLAQATGRTLYQLRKEAQAGARLKTPGQVSKFVVDSEKKGFFDWLQSYFVNGLISGPATHGTYMVGNELLALFKATAETGAQALVSHLRDAPEAERARLGEITQQLYGMFRGARYGWQSAWDAFKANETIRLPGEKIAAGTPFNKGVIPNPAGIPIGTVLEGPSRVVTALHSFTRVQGYTTSISRQAYRIAAGEGLTGNRLAARIYQLTQDPTEEMMAEAVGEANENAMMRRAPYQSITNAIQQITNAGIRFPDIPLPGDHALPLGTLRPLKFIDPFVSISMNVIDSSIVRRTPVGLLSPQIRDDLMGRNGGAAFDKAAGRMLAGTAFYVLAGSLAAAGLATGAGPSAPDEAALKRMTGWQPYSIKIGDMYFATHRLGVIGMGLGVGADLYDTAHALSTEDGAKIASMAVHAFAQNILDESFMRGPSELIQALDDSDRYGAGFVRSFISSFVPFSVGDAQIARAIDPYTRQTRTTMDSILAKIPWASEELMPRRDIWGEPIPNYSSPVPGLLAIYESRINNDPVNAALQRLQFFPAMPERKIRGVELTEPQYDDYARIGGRMAKMQLDRIVPAPGFSQLPDAAQHEIISRTISGAREAARSLIMMQNPGIIQAATAAKLGPLHGH